VGSTTTRALESVRPHDAANGDHSVRLHALQRSRSFPSFSIVPVA
jgi:hypothetical protein